MGSPRVFHTAPPQPASKARITCSPQLAGGPEASQNGLGQRMPPAKFVVRSAMLLWLGPRVYLPPPRQPLPCLRSRNHRRRNILDSMSGLSIAPQPLFPFVV